MLGIFYVPIGHLCVFFGKMSIQVLLPIYDWVICFFGIELYELFAHFGY